MIRTRMFVSLSAALLLSGSLQAEDALVRGESVASACVACHGENGEGNAAAGFPRLAGLDKSYLTKQIKDYQNNRRASAVMAPNVASLDDDDIDAVAAYYAEMSAPEPSLSEADESLLQRGERLALRGNWDDYIPPCTACHGPDNNGVGGEFPALSGQHASYIRNELKAWQAGTRRNDPIDLMAAVANRMSEEQIEAVAAYLASRPAASSRAEQEAQQ